jgi:hypothetical protein
MQRAILTVLAYVIATFAVQATSHFGINAEHYAQLPNLRPEPIVPMGITAMLVQGLVMAWLYPRLDGAGSSIWHALRFAWVMGAFLVSYIALGESGKYLVPSIASWLAVETIAGFCQFTLFGLMLGLLHRGAVRGAVPMKS